MYHFKLVSIIIVMSFVLYPVAMKPTQIINVMLSYNDKNTTNSAFHRLDVEIVENFGKLLNLKIEYIVTNETLNVVFNAKDRFEKFSKSSEYK